MAVALLSWGKAGAQGAGAGALKELGFSWQPWQSLFGWGHVWGPRCWSSSPELASLFLGANDGGLHLSREQCQSKMDEQEAGVALEGVLGRFWQASWSIRQLSICCLCTGTGNK